MNIIKDNQVGKVYIDLNLFRECPDKLVEITKDLLIVRAESLYVKNKIEYTAYSKHFEKVPIGKEMPIYNADVIIDKDNNIADVKFKEVDY